MDLKHGLAERRRNVLPFDLQRVIDRVKYYNYNSASAREKREMRELVERGEAVHGKSADPQKMQNSEIDLKKWRKEQMDVSLETQGVAGTRAKERGR